MFYKSSAWYGWLARPFRATCFLLASICMLWSGAAWSNCVPTSGWQGTWSGPASPLNVSSKTPNGTLVATYTAVVSNQTYALCGARNTSDVNVMIGGFYRGMVPAPGYSNMYMPYSWNGSTPVPGIGFIFKVNGQPITLNNYPSWIIGPGGGYYSYSGIWTIEIYKIGNLDNTSWLIPLNMAMGTAASGTVSAFGSVSILGVASTCTVTTANVIIPLGDVKADVFTAVGSTSPRSREYNINLSCAANPSVAMSISGTPVSGRTDLFGLNAGTTTAGGIAVQLFRSGLQVTQGQKVVLTSSAGATLSVPIAANYYRTDVVTPGTANARMVATFTYN